MGLLAASTEPVQASSSTTMLNYSLSNEGTSVVTRVDFSVSPSGAVLPPTVTNSDGTTSTGSPVTLLPDSTGFDPNYFSVALGNKPDAQILRLLFGQSQTVDADGNVTFASILDSNGNPIGGFQPGGTLNFGVSVDPATSSSFQLTLPADVPGLALAQLPVEVTANPSTGSNGSSGGTSQPSTSTPTSDNTVPEPMSVMVWGGLFVLGVSRVRSVRTRARKRLAA